jgi:flavin-dependent dehydrogenase
MRYVETIIVGGGPAGSTCARRESVAWQPRGHGRAFPKHETDIEPKPLARLFEQFLEIFQTTFRTAHLYLKNAFGLSSPNRLTAST